MARQVDNQDLDFLPCSSDLQQPHLVQQQELNDLIRDFRKSELHHHQGNKNSTCHKIQKNLFNKTEIKKRQMAKNAAFC